MTAPDRTQAPAFHSIDSYVLPEAVSDKLSNGIPVHLILSGTQPVIRLELIFKAGNWYEAYQGCAHFTAKMLGEGTAKYTAKQIQDKFALYGAFPEFNSGMDHASITVYTLSRHLKELLPLIHDLVSDASFPEPELETVKNISMQGLKVNLEKTAYLAGSKFREKIFGNEHPYGRTLTAEVISGTTRNHLLDYYRKSFTPADCEIVVSGSGEEDFVYLLNTYLGKDNWGKNDNLPYTGREYHQVPFTRREVIEKEGSLQSSIRLGRKLFTLAHPDYFHMYCLNEILGGYFGSRLMQNIREDKGYTYGIHSNVVSQQAEGYFVIGTDVKREFTQHTIDEIYKEILRLKEEPVPENELETVRNYMLGSFINSITTPFAIADKFKTIHFNGLDYSFYKNYFNALKTVNPAILQETARKYLDENAMTEVIAGGME